MPKGTSGLIFALAAIVMATPATAAKAPPPDPLAPLAGSISAVLDITASPRLLLIETDHGVSASRTLGAGDEYKDGWKVASIAADKVVLRKGTAERSVAVPTRAPPGAVTTAPGAFAAVMPAPLPGGPPGAAFGGRGGGGFGGRGQGGPGGQAMASGMTNSQGAAGRASRTYTPPAPGSINLPSELANNPMVRNILQSGQLPPEIAQMMQQQMGGGAGGAPMTFSFGGNNVSVTVGPDGQPVIRQGR